MSGLWRRGHSQQSLSFLLAFYIGIFLNLAVLLRRFSLFFSDNPLSYWEMAVTEVIANISVPFLIFTLFALGGRFFYRITSTILVLISVAASYYMSFFHTVIGYGIIASVLTTDVDLSKEVLSFYFIGWMFILSVVPLYFIWKSPLKSMPIDWCKVPKQGIKSLLLITLMGLIVWASIQYTTQKQIAENHLVNKEMPSYGGVLAHTYSPSNWLTALGLFIYTQYHEYFHQIQLFDPSKYFTYVAPRDIDETYVIFIIGETTRWDHMGLLGYDRDTTPYLSKEKNLVAFRGISCDTTTKLSLRCMFVREGGAKEEVQRTVKEHNIFALLKSLGFSSEVFAMQSEVWFYESTKPNNYVFREMIAAEEKNKGKPIDDMLLLDQLQASLGRYPQGKHLVILHTKGSHYLYSARYPRSYARYQPECLQADHFCTKTQLINSFDNTILYIDTFIKKVIDGVRDKKAVVFYTSDHGESIDDNQNLHGTPRHLAPPEQFRVPVILWASDSFLANPQNQKNFAQLKRLHHQKAIFRHEEIFDTLLGCLGYTSSDGGINPKNNRCASGISVEEGKVQLN